MSSESTNEFAVFPVLPLRDVVVFPHMIFPVMVGRESSLRAASEALNNDRQILLLTQRNPDVEDPKEEDVYRAGTVAKIAQMLRLPNGLMKILVEGESQALVNEIAFNGDYLEAAVSVVNPTVPTDRQMQALQRQTATLFQEYVQTHRGMPPEMATTFDSIEDPVRRLYFVAANLLSHADVKQRILEAHDLKTQYLELVKAINEELEVLKLEQEIDLKVQDTIQKSQRQFLIQEQIRALQNELEEEGELPPELAKLKEAIEKAGMPEEAKAKADEELEKLRKTPFMSPEFAVSRSYLEWLTSVPWSERTIDRLDIDHVREVLDDDHYGLEKPKERILEHIAVLNLVKEMRGQILCFVGPPGVGKTSLGKSIAKALGRKFVRVSLGGVRDEAEVRGHRRTYIGSMPGRVIQSMKRAGTINPVVLLDEIDKMSMDFRGDPSSAMLEVLDPEQNVAFNDHYLEVDYDLSQVFFITTANVLQTIPAPLLDRMEVIRISGYLEHDKLEIAKRHIVPKQLEKHGLGDKSVRFSDDALMKIIRDYTSEAGVRNLEREIASICRKVAKEIVSRRTPNGTVDEGASPKGATTAKKTGGKGSKKKDAGEIVVTPDRVEEFLKAPRYRKSAAEKEDIVGTATGLAWTATGGETLSVEVSIIPGKERLTLTGQLGDVMKESVSAALTYIRANSDVLAVPPDFFKDKEVHVHIPEGAIPKDGPSAGITIAVAVLSAASGRAIRSDVAMTGEITLRGRILPIGGLTEKLMAARRAGMTTVIIPKENEIDLWEAPAEVREGMEIVVVKHLSEAIPHVFRSLPVGNNGIAKKTVVKKGLVKKNDASKQVSAKPKSTKGPRTATKKTVVKKGAAKKARVAGRA